jgi:hypothetical protein
MQYHSVKLIIVTEASGGPLSIRLLHIFFFKKGELSGISERLLVPQK